MKRRWVLLFTLFAGLLMLTGCVPGDGTNTVQNPAGFFWGIWHGWVAPISLIIGLFKDSIRIYETHNTGWWYDLGFYLAVISGFGSLSFRRKSKSCSD
ncbi:hypothetical protein [Paenibacillus montanisoli]|uniref:Lipoprotein n=1 Tax=Paenibacillus montanisoli TaxID=2081970 RepID=A0A328TZQ9_9BACL|nr:hypothetical protein [Paenibacillus montanisoli]RAP75929.1 hypothetical protein DL346_10890 [Paenibacillus montanisoli]